MAENVPRAERTPLVGPIFFWELIRQSRKGRGYFTRVVYALAMLGVLTLMLGADEITQKNAAYLSERAVFLYLMVQYAAVILLTPLFVVGAFIEDRQQNTLQLLLTTFLSPREIVLGKLFGRLIYVAGTLLAGLPVLALLQLLGGVDLVFLLSHSLLALAFLLVCGLYAIRASTLCKTVGGAILMTYTMLAGGGLITSVISVPLTAYVAIQLGPGGGMFVWGSVVMSLNVVFAFLALRNAIRSLKDREKDQDFGAMQFTGPNTQLDLARQVIVIDVPVPQAKEAAPNGQTAAAGVTTQRIHGVIRWKSPPRVWDRPILWKETYFPLSDVDALLAGICCGLPLTVFFSSFVSHESFLAVRPFVAWSCQAMMLLVLTLTTLRASWVFAQERLQQTLVPVLCLPLSMTNMVVQAWLGSVWRFAACLIGTVILGLATTIYEPLAGLMILLAFGSQLAFFTMSGTVLSTCQLTPFQARCLVGSYLFVGVVVLPSFIRPWVLEFPFCLTMLVCPFLSWELIQSRFDWHGNLGSVRDQIPDAPRPGLFEAEHLGGFAVLEGVLLLTALTAVLLLLARLRLRHLSEESPRREGRH